MTRRRDIPGSWGARIARNLYNLNSFCLDWLQFTGPYDMPQMQPCYVVPENLFPYDERNKYRGEGAIHFYCEDAEFESVWLRANQSPHMPAVVYRAGVAIAPDFSLYHDLPTPTQIWNSYRSKLLGALWQQLGIEVIPNASWSNEASFEWAFDGMPVGGSVAIATSNIHIPEEREMFMAGFEELIRRCQPDTVLVYGAGFRGQLEAIANVRRYQTRLTQIHNQRKAA